MSPPRTKFDVLAVFVYTNSHQFDSMIQAGGKLSFHACRISQL